MYLKQATLKDMRDAMLYIWDSNLPPHAHHSSRTAALGEIRDAYAGGRRALRFLQRKPGESKDQWESRRGHFNNVRLVKTICDARSDMIYGNPPERCFYIDGVPEDDPSMQDMDDAIGKVYTDSNIKILMRQRVAPARFRDQESNLKLITTDDEKSPLRLAYLPSECVLWVPDPDDVDAILGVIEIRKHGRDYKMTSYTFDTTCDVKDDWTAVAGTEEDNWLPGMLPIVRFGGIDIRNDFGSWTEDAVLDQKHLINVRSQFDLGFRSGAFPVLTVAGTIKGTTYKGEDGKERILMSPESVIELEEGGLAQFLNPNFPLEAASAVEKGWVKMALEAYGVSGYTVDPSGAPEQPMSLMIKMFRPMQLRSEDVADFEQSERTLADLVKAAAYEVGLINYAPDAIMVDIEFPESVLPMDKQAERTADAADVAATPPRMTIADYVKKHVLQDASDQDVTEYLAELNAQASALTQNRATVIGALAPRTGILDRIANPGGIGVPGGPAVTYSGNGSGPGGSSPASGSTGGGGVVSGHGTGGSGGSGGRGGVQ